jgi:hypothetical protein
MGWERSTTSYPDDWAAIRKRWAARHRDWHPCVRCGRALGPMNRNLHLDHDDHDRSIVRGFAHAKCNMRAAALKGNRVKRGMAARPVRSRQW